MDIAIGQLVCLKADRSRQGPVIEVLPSLAGMMRYRVFHSPTDIREYQADQIDLVESPIIPDELVKALLQANWLDPMLFQARLTAARLAYPQADHLYAIHSARIRFIPFQLKPLLRLLRSDRPRLLIADEVGVGKTIEAGLILKELQTRNRLDHVLILCPKALVNKWREEMRRFDEDFRPLSAENLRYCLRETHLDGVWPQQYARSIVHLELLRVDQYLLGESGKKAIPGLMNLNPRPHFDLVIVDEAHHVRTPESNSNNLARFLCDISEAVLFLSATPVHIGSQNLFSLLNLLRPDVFPDFRVFQEMTEPNRFLLQAIRYVRSSSPANEWQELAAQALEEAEKTAWGQNTLHSDPIFRDWHDQLKTKQVTENADRVRCIRDLEETHTLAHIMNRTRRRDIGKFTLREPHTVSVPFTDLQRSFYEELLEFRENYLLQWHDLGVVRLILDTLERQAASCLPALVTSLGSLLKMDSFQPSMLSDDPEIEDFNDAIPVGLEQQALRLQRRAAALPAIDPKYDHLLAIVQGQLSGSGSRKTLVFSFFLNTLAYLAARLKNDGARFAVITGRVPDEERETLRNRFRLPFDNPEALDILLSSEVGCEGLDYEFCDCLINPL